MVRRKLRGWVKDGEKARGRLAGGNKFASTAILSSQDIFFRIMSAEHPLIHECSVEAVQWVVRGSPMYVVRGGSMDISCHAKALDIYFESVKTGFGSRAVRRRRCFGGGAPVNSGGAAREVNFFQRCPKKL